MPREALVAVLFADVSGSTQMYERFGDARAQAIIARCIALMTEATRRHGGTLIKTIGDEVMTTFPEPAQAAEAACDMQDAIAGQIVEGRPLAIRVGFHFGPALLEGGDVFGDAVNLAARMAAQAKPAQILTTGTTAAAISGPRRAACRLIDRAQVKGKSEVVEIHELVWKAEDATLMRAPWAAQPRPAARLVLTAGATRLELGESQPSITIGRAGGNELVVQQPLVSRLHARVEYRPGRFVLTDLSANGTYVAGDDGSTRYVHRDSLELTGSGTLGLGEAVTPEAQAIVRYAPG